jgi:preprotein translocase subunit SecA
MAAVKQAAVGMGVARAAREQAENAAGERIISGSGSEPTEAAEKPRPIRVEKKVGRNEPCPCGSGKKYKHCHGKNE